MIHNILASLYDTLPFQPPILIAAICILIAATVLVLYGRSKTTVFLSLAIVLLGTGLTIGLSGIPQPGDPQTWGDAEEIAASIVGPPAFRRREQFTVAGLVLAGVLFYAVYNLAFQEKPGEHSRRQLERDEVQAKALGSAHLCQPGRFKRWSKPDPQGWAIRGRFYGAGGRSLGSRFCLSGEDIARGVAVFGAQGTGKTQSVILPAIADRMQDGHSLIVTDVQSELLPYIQSIAAVTGHTILVHDPSDPQISCSVNLCDWIGDVADARAMSTVLHSQSLLNTQHRFWTESAINLVAACALHYPTFGHILDVRTRDIKQMALDLKASRVPGVANLAADFADSILTRDSKLGLNAWATAYSACMSLWTSAGMREVTGRTDVDLAVQMTGLPTVLVLRCAQPKYRKTHGAYLGTILRVLTTRLDELGQQAGGQLPIPVGLILEEFPELGRLDSLVEDINLVRKRRISVLIAAQSLSQFDHIYPAKGEADRLMAGLATKIVFGGCDQKTAEFFSRVSGQQTITLTSLSRAHRRPGQGLQDTASASLQGRPLLLPDDVIRPGKGAATIFAAYSEAGLADQAIFHARLTPFFKRRDWKRKQKRLRPKPIFVVSRPARAQPELPPAPAGEPGQEAALELAQALAGEAETLER